MVWRRINSVVAPCPQMFYLLDHSSGQQAIQGRLQVAVDFSATKRISPTSFLRSGFFSDAGLMAPVSDSAAEESMFFMIVDRICLAQLRGGEGLSGIGALVGSWSFLLR